MIVGWLYKRCDCIKDYCFELTNKTIVSTYKDLNHKIIYFSSVLILNPGFFLKLSSRTSIIKPREIIEYNIQTK